MKRNKSQSIMRRLLAMVVALLLMLSMAVMPASAETSQAVADQASKGVFLIMYCCPNPDNRHDYLYPVSIGSGFLVNETTVVTCYHVFHNAELIEAMKATYGNNWRNKMEIRVYYSSGSFYTATEIQSVANSTADFTALKLSKPLNGSLSLALKGNTEETVHRTDEVYALGFPSDLEYIEDQKVSSLTSSDVDVRTGNVNKLASVGGVQTINHSATLKPAMSGGPLLDAEGNVIGINAATTNNSEVYNYAISIDPLINALNVNNIEYKVADGSSVTPEPDTTTEPGVTDSETTTEAPVPALNWTEFNNAFAQASSKTEDGYTAESFAELKAALTIANSVKEKGDNATQDEIDDAATKLTSAVSALVEAKQGAPMKMMIIIALAVVLVLAIIIVIVLVSRKGKNIEAEAAPAPMPVNPPQYNDGWKATGGSQAPSFNVQQSSDSAETGVLSGGSTATTVLSSGANETTVLNSRPYATLVRKSNNETVQVTATPFVIGKERRRVNYCISDNTTISRSHAQIVKNGANISIIDMNSKNGTFVNGVKCDANAAVALKSGDKITLADEDFVFNIL